MAEIKTVSAISAVLILSSFLLAGMLQPVCRDASTCGGNGRRIWPVR
jgi:hypothetical protein